MSETKYTPGPWTVRMMGEDCFVQANRAKPEHPYDIEIMTDDVNEELYSAEQKLADAHLIAAAPDMLEVLEHIHTYFDVIAKPNPVSVELLKKIAPVLDKAKRQ